MYCKNCGHEVRDDDTFCLNCGAEIDKTPVNYTPANDNKHHTTINVDNPNPLVGILCFLMPILGLILFIVWKKEKPKCSKQAGIIALVSTILSVVSIVFIIVIMVLLLISLA